MRRQIKYYNVGYTVIAQHFRPLRHVIDGIVKYFYFP